MPNDQQKAIEALQKVFEEQRYEPKNSRRRSKTWTRPFKQHSAHKPQPRLAKRSAIQSKSLTIELAEDAFAV